MTIRINRVQNSKKPGCWKNHLFGDRKCQMRGTAGPGANVFEKCKRWLSWEEGLGGNLTM